MVCEYKDKVLVKTNQDFIDHLNEIENVLKKIL